MDNNTLEKIENLLSILNEQEKKQDILEINQKENTEIYEYLEKIGNLHIDYTIEYENFFLPRETEGSLYLWNKELNNKWKINLYNVNKMLNAKWKK